MIISLIPAIIGALIASPSDGSGFAVQLSAYAAFIVAIATAGTLLYQRIDKKKKDKLDESALGTSTRSVSVEEIEAAIPGLGSLVSIWQAQAKDAFVEIERLKESEDMDRKRIADLEIQIKVLTQDLVAEKAKNIKLEERIQQLETERLGTRK